MNADKAILRLNRRTVVTGCLSVCIPGSLRAESAPPSGAVSLIFTRKGVAGIVMQGEEGVTLDPTYRWHIGSNTKALTAALYARLVDQRRCRWRASIPALFPSLPVHPGWTDRRVEDLLSHAAGLADSIVDSTWLRERHTDRTPAREQRRLLVERVLASPPDGELGIYRYGNLNYVLVGAAIEEAMDASWEDVMDSELFAPLAMQEVGFGAPPRTGPWGREGDGASAKPVDPAGIADNPKILWPSGGVHMTPGNYAQFLSIFLREGEPLLRRETMAHLLTASHPSIRYAGGWSLAGSASFPAERLTHNGSNTLWFATALVDRGTGRGYAAVVNKGGDAGAKATTRLIKSLGAEL